MNKTFKTTAIVIATLTTAIFAQSCNKEEHGNQAPVITLEEPEENTVVQAGSALHIEGSATDDDQLHEGRFQLITDGGASLWDTALTVHGLSEYNFHTHYHTTVSDTTNATLKVTFSDHDELVTTKEVAVQFLP